MPFPCAGGSLLRRIVRSPRGDLPASVLECRSLPQAAHAHDGLLWKCSADGKPRRAGDQVARFTTSGALVGRYSYSPSPRQRAPCCTRAHTRYPPQERLVDRALSDFGNDASLHVLKTINLLMLKLLQHAPVEKTLCALLTLLSLRAAPSRKGPLEQEKVRTHHTNTIDHITPHTTPHITSHHITPLPAALVPTPFRQLHFPLHPPCRSPSFLRSA